MKADRYGQKADTIKVNGKKVQDIKVKPAPSTTNPRRVT